MRGRRPDAIRHFECASRLVSGGACFTSRSARWRARRTGCGWRGVGLGGEAARGSASDANDAKSTRRRPKTRRTRTTIAAGHRPDAADPDAKDAAGPVPRCAARVLVGASDEGDLLIGPRPALLPPTVWAFDFEALETDVARLRDVARHRRARRALRLHPLRDPQRRGSVRAHRLRERPVGVVQRARVLAPLVPVRRRPRLDVSSPRRRSGARRVAQGGRGARCVRGQGIGRGAGLGGPVRPPVVQRRGEQGG